MSTHCRENTKRALSSVFGISDSSTAQQPNLNEFGTRGSGRRPRGRVGEGGKGCTHSQARARGVGSLTNITAAAAAYLQPLHRCLQPFGHVFAVRQPLNLPLDGRQGRLPDGGKRKNGPTDLLRRTKQTPTQISGNLLHRHRSFRSGTHPSGAFKRPFNKNPANKSIL